MSPGLPLARLAEEVGGEIRGDGERRVAAVRALEEAGPDDLAVWKEPAYRERALACRAGVLVLAPALLPALAADPGRTLLLVADPGLALVRLLALLHPATGAVGGVHPTAVILAGAEVDASAEVGPYAVIGERATVGPRARIGAHAVVGPGSRIAADAVLHPHVVLYADTEVGERTTIHAGTVLGADGFGYVSRAGVHHKVPQVGRTVIEADVEVGALAAIDRATLGETRIGTGSKIDNLVQVGHNVAVGRGSILCGQAGIAGSTRLGEHVVLAGQAGVAGHLEIGSRVMVAAKSAVLQSVAEGQQMAGIPAVPRVRWHRQNTMIARLGELRRRLRELEQRLGIAPASRAATEDEV